MREYKVTITERESADRTVSFSQSEFTESNINAFFESLSHLLAWRNIEVKIEGSSENEIAWKKVSEIFGLNDRVSYVCSNPYDFDVDDELKKQDFLSGEIQPLNLALVFDGVLQEQESYVGISMLEAA